MQLYKIRVDGNTPLVYIFRFDDALPHMKMVPYPHFSCTYTYRINDLNGLCYPTLGGASAPTPLYTAPAPTRLLIQLTEHYSLLHW